MVSLSLYTLYILCIFYIFVKNKKMNTVVKRKNIDLPETVLKKLSLMAVAQGKSLKAYIEALLISKADNISIEVYDNPSPSKDKWFDNPENIKEISSGIADANDGNTYAMKQDESLNDFIVRMRVEGNV